MRFLGHHLPRPLGTGPHQAALRPAAPDALRLRDHYGAAISALRHPSSLPDSSSQEVLFEAERPTPILYADAFFSLGDRSYRPGYAEIPLVWRQEAMRTADNGWGFVLFPADRARPPLYAYGSVPPAVLQRFATRRAFIFILEALAQCLPLWALGPALAGPY